MSEVINSIELDDALLTEEQRIVIDKCVHWALFGGKSTLTVGGFAGTGKSTIIKKVLQRLKEKRIAIVAFTGKAVSVLRRKNLRQSQTVHSLIYVHVGEDKFGQPLFKKVKRIDCGLIIVDEASLINKEMDEDLRSFGVPILYVGDHGQLEPIGDDPNLMKNPDLVLEEIHRNAGPIATFCEALRKISPLGYYNGGKVLFFRRGNQVSVGNRSLFEESVRQADVCICGYNKTRHGINALVRKYKGLLGESPRVGDRLICLQNNRALGVFNGLMVDVLEVGGPASETVRLTFRDDLGTVWEKVKVSKEQFGRDRIDLRKPGVLYFDYGYCVTAHKATGSEWDHVLVVEEIARSWNRQRWSYTAASRAIRKLCYCINVGSIC